MDILSTLSESVFDRAMLNATGLHPTEVELAEANRLLAAVSSAADPDWRTICRARGYKIPAWLTAAVGAVPLSEAQVVARFCPGRSWRDGRGAYRLLVACGRIGQGGQGRGRCTLVFLRRPLAPAKYLPGSDLAPGHHPVDGLI